MVHIPWRSTIFGQAYNKIYEHTYPQLSYTSDQVSIGICISNAKCTQDHYDLVRNYFNGEGNSEIVENYCYKVLVIHHIRIGAKEESITFEIDILRNIIQKIEGRDISDQRPPYISLTLKYEADMAHGPVNLEF